MSSNPMPPGRMRGWVDAIAGFPIFRSKTSVRVGSGTGLSSLDGTDGVVAANGNGNGGFVMGDQTNPNAATWATWLYTGGSIHLDTVAAGGTILAISGTTGLTTQSTWTNATLGNSWTNLSGRVARYRLIKPTGQVEIQGFITAGTYGVAAFTLPSTMWPSQEIDFAGAVWSGAAWQTTANPVNINTNGTVIVAAGTAGHSTSINWTFSI